MKQKHTAQTKNNTKLIVYLILVVIASLAIYLMFVKGDSSNDLTQSWDGVILTQTTDNKYLDYQLSINGTTLSIEDQSIFSTFSMGEVGKEEKEKAKKEYEETIAKFSTLKVGQYDDFKVSKKGKAYTLHVKGKNPFTYTLKQTAPRQFIGEDGISFAANKYID